MVPAVCHASFMSQVPKRVQQRINLSILTHSSSDEPPLSSLEVLRSISGRRTEETSSFDSTHQYSIC